MKAKPWRLAVLGALGALGCGTPSTAGSAASDAPTGQVYIAFAQDFSDFRAWDHFPVLSDGSINDPAHADPTLVEYINQRLPAGRSEFPVGTIIVKEGSQGGVATPQFFAMVKRGGNYNAQGALNWEWFELQNLADGSQGVSIVWRGFGPPQGEIYGGNAKAGCNECHVMAPFDSVFAAEARQ